MNHPQDPFPRRSFLQGALTVGAGFAASALAAAEAPAVSGSGVILPRTDRRILLSCKLGMITKESEGRKLTLTERLRLAGDAGFDGVDFDEAGGFTAVQARDAVLASGVFVHSAINHAHWGVRLTDARAETRAQARANLDHCMRVSHAAGGSGVLLVVGKGEDGPAGEIEERCRAEIRKSLPLAAALGQKVLFENVWNRMMYDHDQGPEQGAERFVKFVDSFDSPWVGMYYDIGNHWKYGQPGAWLRAFRHRCVKLDIKGFSRARSKFVDITSADDDVPWDKVREGLAEIGFAGWATAEVGGGDLKRLTTVREQMQKALGV